MRVSTAMTYDQGVANLNRQSSAYLKTQNQLATGRRILSPSDDPVAAARALDVSQTKSMNAQFMKNQGAASDSLKTAENALASVGDLLQNVRENVLKANSSTLDDKQRGMIATELRQQFSQLMGLANAKDQTGEYLFGGFGLQAGASAPFAGTPGAMQPYYGDQGQREMQVSPSRRIAVNNSGFEVFMDVPDAAGGKQSVFDTLSNVIAAVETPGGVGLAATVQTELQNIDNAMNNAFRVRADIGARMSEVEALSTSLGALDTQYASTLSDLQDLDYNEAISRSMRLQTALTAAQQTFMKATQLSLFNYLP